MKSQYILPLTIVVAGALIAGAVFWAGKAGTTNPNGGDTSNLTIRPYDATVDHVLGNPKAPVKIVEYMDLECPHCKVFSTTMQQVMDYYNKNNPGQVAWIERPFPLAQIHSKAPEEAQAAECAAAQGGDTAYYKFVNQVFAITPSDNGLDLAQLPVIAQQQGLDVTKFNQCLSSGQYAKFVSDSYAEAIKEGGQGTPYILVMVNDQLVPGGNLSGDQPYESMRAIIDAVVATLPPAVPAATQ
ncbi:MAG: thioredoxin domain-containing protein [Patescibacteria group bacterium]